jgi:hypothetical protein
MSMRHRVCSVSLHVPQAPKLGVPPSTLEYRIKALKIRKSQFKFR